ncbi:MAG: RusA family crossover junction endodeoxyribonuclease [Clostridiales bacterium]|nr:RusA family crossover junction endodeoxyribonuclease [Clostridiales bacterium]
MSKTMIEFFLPIVPPTVTHQAKELCAYMKDGKPHAVLHDSAELKDARAKLHAHLAPYRPAEPMTGAVRLVVKWCFPQGDHRDGEYRITKPDTDNLEKMLKDVMTDLHFWKDDAQVASEICEKFWAERPGIYIRIESI